MSARRERGPRRNGYRSRPWATRAGELELAIPKLRRGSYFPSFLEPRRRSEQALVSVVQEAYVAGVSTRKVDQVVESLGLRISKSEVSRICQGLVGRRYLSNHSLEAVLDQEKEANDRQEARQLTSA